MPPVLGRIKFTGGKGKQSQRGRPKGGAELNVVAGGEVPFLPKADQEDSNEKFFAGRDLQSRP